MCVRENVSPHENWLTDLPTGQDENEISIQEAKPQIEGEICLNKELMGWGTKKTHIHTTNH